MPNVSLCLLALLMGGLQPALVCEKFYMEYCFSILEIFCRGNYNTFNATYSQKKLQGYRV